MARTWMHLPLALLSTAALALAVPQSAPQLTPREIFYRPATQAPAQQASAQQAQAPRPAAATSPAPAAQQAAGPSTAPQQAQPPTTAAQAPRPQPQQPAGAISTTPILQTVSYNAPAALRYSLLKRAASGFFEEVDADTVFQSGDGIRLSVESNDAGYLYIVARGTSGSWNVLFPNSATLEGDNRIEAYRRQQLPAGGQFTFDERPGTEMVFIVFAREPESDLESLIYSLDRAPAPAAPATPAQPLRLLAQNTIPDDVLADVRMRLVSRDLVFEKVDDAVSDRREKAVYVVNANAAERRVVVDLRLEHR